MYLSSFILLKSVMIFNLRYKYQIQISNKNQIHRRWDFYQSVNSLKYITFELEVNWS